MQSWDPRRGIAAGRTTSTLPSGLQGVAPDAQVVAAQVFSFDPTNANAPRAFDADLLIGAQYLATITAAGDNFTANLSVATPLSSFNADCDYTNTAFSNAVATLHSQRIPFVIATGNDSFSNAINWPACTPYAIKASGTLNSSSFPNTIASQANRAPDTFTGPLFFAPGFNLTSSMTDSNTYTDVLGGTSMAAPHITGFYALIKGSVTGITVPDATAFIYTNGVTVTEGSNSWKRIKAPNYP